jgi:hypothetical protein
MPADPIHLDQLGGAAVSRRPGQLPGQPAARPAGRSAQRAAQPPAAAGLGVLMVALNERLPDAYKLLPPAGQPGPGEGRRRSHGSWSPTARSPAPRQPSGIMTGRARSATASPRTTSATVGVPTGSAPSTSGRPTAGRCRSRRHAPSLGCRWAATRTRSTTSRQTGRGDGWVRSATARMADGSAARPSASPDPMPGLVVTAWTVAAGRAECDDPDAHDEVAPPRPRLRQSPPVAATCS